MRANAVFIPLLLASVPLTRAAPGAADATPAEKARTHQATIEKGDLTMTVGDHMPHGGGKRPNYTGIHYLSHRSRAESIFRDIYAGMIGVRQPCSVEARGDDAARILVGNPEHPRITEAFRVVPPHYIDYEASFTAGGVTGHWNNTCYMQGISRPELYIRTPEGEWAAHMSVVHGDRASVAPAGMDPLPSITPSEAPKYPHGSDKFWEGFAELRFDPHFPVVYGRIDDMVLIYMAERRRGRDFIPYMSPTGGGGPTCPAWDFRYWLRGLEPGSTVTVRIRLCYKRWAGEEDVIEEYERWEAEPRPVE